uniref:Uncharacterized protein n=1 Tax=Aegilops tauschii subsp. strangulata TaxID=200361 RepID=A0A453AEM8_AEGTS
ASLEVDCLFFHVFHTFFVLIWSFDRFIFFFISTTQCKYIFSSSTSTPMITHHYPEILFFRKHTSI